jgi:anaerobic magnesium-protoporphyrin IX monomethyl ester cyclase
VINSKIMLVSPASIFDPKDPFTTGVVYMPIGLAYGAAALKRANINVHVYDLFGEEPKRAERIGDFVRLGASDRDLLIEVEKTQPKLVLFYANQLLNHAALIQSIKLMRVAYPNLIIGVAENTQAVTSYLLKEVSDEFYDQGVSFLISGEMEKVIVEVASNIFTGLDVALWRIPGVSSKENDNFRSAIIQNLDELENPAWELFPIENYWKLGFSHGPLTSKKYLPILTSRGCPFPCKFCVVPSTNNRKWRFRSAINVVDEIEQFIEEFDVKEFHLEDLNPTIQDIRMQQIAKEIVTRGLDINWKIVAGTKIESIKSLETLRLMRRSGLSYLSMSPESGSKRVLKDIGKPFDVKHALMMIRESNRIGVKTQTCFVLGYPTEKFSDRVKSLLLVMRLTVAGADEIVVFIMTPVPGSDVYKSFAGQFDSLSSLSFSPRWRMDFNFLLIWRLLYYAVFLILKFARNPSKMISQIFNMKSGRFETKMEMTPVRGIKYFLLSKALSK